MTVKLYTMNKCDACGLMKSLLDTKSIEYEVINISESEEAFRYFKEQNYRYLPVVEVYSGDEISGVCVGYQPDDVLEMVGIG